MLRALVETENKMQEFVILGLPRSGTTYLTLLLNSHPEIQCHGEMFNPFSVIRIKPDRRDVAVFERDARPIAAVNAFFDEAREGGFAVGGFKFMLGHNIAVLQHLAERDGLKIIHLRRPNRLAQASSMIKAAQTRAWAEREAPPHLSGVKLAAWHLLRSARRSMAVALGRRPRERSVQEAPDLDDEGRLTVGPRRISHLWHQNATLDFLAAQWLGTKDQDVMRLQYSEMFEPGFEDRICEFLGVAPSEEMYSNLRKQNANRVIDRFNPKFRDVMGTYFSRINLGHWLEDELDPAQRQRDD